VDHPVLASHPKAFKLDLSLLLYNVNSSQVGPKGATRSQEHQVGSNLDRSWIDRCSEVLLRGGSIEPIAPMKGVVSNSDRAVGSMLSGEIARRFGAQGLPDRTIQVDLEGVAGQSFGAFLTSGVELRLLGQANDYVGKGLSGGTIVIRPAFSRSRAGSNWILAGNTSLYGATSGAVYIAGTVGERFAVRNSGACAVVEGVGDHGCEYMTGGIVVILGPTGKNFGAGMSGGIAFVYDELDEFRYRCNLTMIELEAISDSDESLVFGMMSEHQLRTGSLNARKILDNWKVDRGLFKKVLPLGHRKILNEKLENLHVSAAI
jgi:glutamate synthase (NADPH/NADH) large chain